MAEWRFHSQSGPSSIRGQIQQLWDYHHEHRSSVRLFLGSICLPVPPPPRAYQRKHRETSAAPKNRLVDNDDPQNPRPRMNNGRRLTLVNENRAILKVGVETGLPPPRWA